jgi:hypothetical protein
VTIARYCPPSSFGASSRIDKCPNTARHRVGIYAFSSIMSVQ